MLKKTAIQRGLITMRRRRSTREAREGVIEADSSGRRRCGRVGVVERLEWSDAGAKTLTAMSRSAA